MHTHRFALAIVGLAALAGCAVAPSGPSVIASPGTGKSFDAFQADDASCRLYAQQQTGITPGSAANQSLVGSAAVGTALGAAAGAAIGAATGNPAAGAAIGAASGLGLGTIAGAGAAQYAAGSTQSGYDASYMQCMLAKGNTVQPFAAYPQTYGYPYYGTPYGYPYYGYYGPNWWGWGAPSYLSFGFGFGGYHPYYHRYHGYPHRYHH